MDASSDQINVPIIKDPKDFDDTSGGKVERIIFNNRIIILFLCGLVTAFLGWQALQLNVNSSFEDMIPQSHPYIKNFFENRESLPSSGNAIKVVVQSKNGDIFDKDYLLKLQEVTDALYLLNGVDRNWVRGLWTPSLRWTEVTEMGYRGGAVMPDDWDGSQDSMRQLQENLSKAGVIGSYVSNDLRSSLIKVPLLDRDPDTLEPLDYGEFAKSLDEKIRVLGNEDVKIRVVGFAQVVGDLISGLYEVMKFFAVSVVIASLFVWYYTRCIRSTILLVVTAVVGVVWLLGLMHLLGFDLDPYSILVPFLVFAIGLSHGAQKMNGIMQDIARGMHKYAAARFTFRRLFMAGLTALLANAVGFAVLMIIDIPVIRNMALITSVGVTILVFTKLILIPISLSYIGVNSKAAHRSIHNDDGIDGVGRRCWKSLAALTERRKAVSVILVAFLLTGGALTIRSDIKIGDLDPGAPELRPDSRYNLDSKYVTEHYGLSQDEFIVMLKTPSGECARFETLVEADRLSARLSQVPGVQSTFSTSEGVKRAISGMFEGNPNWLSIPRNSSNLSQAVLTFRTDRPDLVDRSCAITPIIAYLENHEADTLTAVVDEVEAFASEHNAENREFLLAAGNAGIEAVTNIVVKRSFWQMHFVLYGAVALLCFITFRSWRAVLVALIPLVITSLLCEALMVLLGIGIKVATLPVIAVGVGVGVDYALYLLSVQLSAQRRGMRLREAYMHSLDFTGKIVALVGLTMAASVITWAWSPIKFQADMGILLTFMFIWNMIGALILIPALSHFLLKNESGKKEVVPVVQSDGIYESNVNASDGEYVADYSKDHKFGT